jgi:5,10-methylenetetrahydromethanopterin reductase
VRGEVVHIDGAPCQMMHSPGWAPSRPIDVPRPRTDRPEGLRHPRDVADGVILTAPPAAEDRHWERAALLVNGSVLDRGEDHNTPRLRDAVGPAYVTGFHALAEWAPDLVRDSPGGGDWLQRLDAERSREERHLSLHEGHLVTVTQRDEALLDVAGERLLATGWTGDAASISARMDAVGSEGISEVVYCAAGPDIERELEAFAAAARS